MTSLLRYRPSSHQTANTWVKSVAMSWEWWLQAKSWMDFFAARLPPASQTPVHESERTIHISHMLTLSTLSRSLTTRWRPRAIIWDWRSKYSSYTCSSHPSHMYGLLRAFKWRVICRWRKDEHARSWIPNPTTTSRLIGDVRGMSDSRHSIQIF